MSSFQSRNRIEKNTLPLKQYPPQTSATQDESAMDAGTPSRAEVSPIK